MKRFGFFALLLAALLIWGTAANAQTPATLSVQGERIEQFDANIQVQKDASLAVTETIHYVFPEGQERHGIYRDIPLNGISISHISVTDEKGAPYTFTTSKQGGTEDIKIGDAAVTVTGAHTYILQYTVTGAIRYFKTYDEVYWNATGNDWNYPIVHSTQKVSIPAAVSQNALQSYCYSGTIGSTADCNSGITTNAVDGQTVVSFDNNTRFLNPAEGITVAVGFPKGTVFEPTTWQKFVMALQQHIELILSIIAFIAAVFFSLRYWMKYGRNAKDSSVIIPQYDVPDGLHPSEVGAVMDKQAKNKSISAELIQLAIKGYIKIEKLEKGFFSWYGDYNITLLKDVASDNDQLDVILLQGLFTKGITAGQTVTLSDLRGSFYRTANSFKKAVDDSMAQKQYFKKKPAVMRTIGITIGTLGLFIVIFISAFLASIFSEFYFIPILILTVIVVAICIYNSTGRTVQGVEAKEYILGLKEYLQIAEKDRINFHNAPEKKPEVFEAFLPYAMVLGVEKSWAKEFEGIYVTPPTWYSDPSMRQFNTFALMNSFNSFNTASAASFASPSSSSSGSGGGGFSGGGSGGGGGGSW